MCLIRRCGLSGEEEEEEEAENGQDKELTSGELLLLLMTWLMAWLLMALVLQMLGLFGLRLQLFVGGDKDGERNGAVGEEVVVVVTVAAMERGVVAVAAPFSSILAI